MPINAGPLYYLAEERFLKATTPEEKIKCLEEMIREVPKHKGTENVLSQLKKKLAVLKAESKSGKKGAKFKGIEKTGDAQVCIIGKTNSGKSSLLKALTGKDVKISEKAFTTTQAEVAMMNYGGANIQMVEIPPNPNSVILSLLHTCELIVALFVDLKEKQELGQMLKKKNLLKKTIFVLSKSDAGTLIPEKIKVSVKAGSGIEDLKKHIWENLGLIRAYTKRGSKVEKVPVVLKKGSNVKDFAKEIHKTFVENFAFARIFDNTQFSGRKVGLNYELKEGDIVEIHTA
jgi:hypothetical protein